MSTTLELVLIVASVLLLAVAFIYLAKKFGATWISKLKSVVDCVVSALESAGVTSDRINTLLNLIVQAITYGLATVTSGETITALTEAALQFVEDIAVALSITLTTEEINIIQTALTIAFDFIMKINFTEAITEKNYQKVYIRMAKYINVPVATKAAGLNILDKRIRSCLLKKKLATLEA